MVKRTVVPVGAGILSVVLLLATLGSPVWLFSFSLARPPCEMQSWFYNLTQLMIPPALFVSTVWMFRLIYRPKGSHFMVALAIPGIALGLYMMASHMNAARQTQCSQRSLGEALAVCGVKKAHYREGLSQYGTITLTLVAPGTTDRAWGCLWSWADRNGSVNLEIDESVYEQARRLHGHR